jgi:hypothetical protein
MQQVSDMDQTQVTEGGSETYIHKCRLFISTIYFNVFVKVETLPHKRVL